MRADYDPASGVRVTSPDGLVELTVPAGALGEIATFSHAGMAPPAAGRGPRLARAFRLEAQAANGGRALTRFDRPLRLVVRYDDADLRAVRADASALGLFYQDAAGSWIAVPSVVDPAARTIKAAVDHFTVFAVGVSQCALACDDFDRADATGLGTAVVGGAWRVRPRDTTVFGLCAGQACAPTSTGEGAYATLDATSADHSVQLTVIEPTGGSGAAGAVVRARGGWDRFLLAEVSTAGQLILWRYDGAWTALDSATIALAAGSRHTLGVSTHGSSIVVTWDGIEQLAVADVDDPSATAAGIYIGTADSRPTLDDVSVTPSNDLPPLPTAVPPTCAAPGSGASDGFKRKAPAGSLGCADSGQSWQNAVDSAWTICDDQRACALAPTGSSSWARIETGLTAQRVSATIAPRSAGAVGQAGILVGLTPDWTTSMLYVGLDAAGVAEVWSVVNGTWSSAPLASAPTGKDATSARTLEARTSGASLELFVDGARVLGPIQVPATPANGTMAGLYADTSGPIATWPQFSAFAVAPGP
ncbi:MAG TPA: hypothetical protein VGL23_18595 [Chloroflexota bacterium]